MMVVKTLPHFRHSKIGSKTDKPKAATNHVSYIMRHDAMTKFQAENMPEGGRGTRGFFDDLAKEEVEEGKEVRICDKFIIAFPIELSCDQRYDLLAGYMHKLGHYRISWCAAHHDVGEDAHNPHAHVVLKDADIETGKKVIGFGTNKRDVTEATKHGWKVPPRMTSGEARIAWCEHLNEYMRSQGFDIQFDHRSHKDRGLEQQPTIHEGQKIHKLKEKGLHPKSKDHERNDRILRYTMTDEGTRIDHNHRVAELNAKFAGQNLTDRDTMTAAPKPKTPEAREKRELYLAHGDALRKLWHEQKLDREALRYAHAVERAEQSQMGRQRYTEARQKAYQQTKQETAPAWQKITGLPKGPERDQASEDLKRVNAQRAADIRLMPQGQERTKAAEQLRLEAAAAWKTIRGMKRGPEREAAYQQVKKDQKTIYERKERPLVEAVKQENATERATLLARQAAEREALWTNHKTEHTALSKQHICERLGVHETWRAYDLEKQSQRINRGLEVRQDMANVQTNAVKMIELHNEARVLKTATGMIAVPQNPTAAAKIYLAEGEHQQDIRLSLRQRLEQTRTVNIQLGDERTIRTKAVLAAREAVHSARQKNVANQNDGAQSIRQAVASGRSLTDGEKANASPELRERIDRQERATKARSVIDIQSIVLEKGRERGDGRERSGGGRGR